MAIDWQKRSFRGEEIYADGNRTLPGNNFHSSRHFCRRQINHQREHDHQRLQLLFMRQQQSRGPQLWRRPPLSSSRPITQVNIANRKVPEASNLDRFVESVTPSVGASFSPEEGDKEEAFYELGDLWESFKEWSFYGAEVPLILNGHDRVKQYYVPFLSGMQLYVEVPPSTEEKQSNSITDSPGKLAFEFVEEEQPYHRKPLYEKVCSLASQNPTIKTYRSLDILPTSWLSVAWYPIYRIPVGSTLQSLEASFLTFHPLSTIGRSPYLERYGMLRGMTATPSFSKKISLPVFGLASYKLRGSMLASNGNREVQQEHVMSEAAGKWVKFVKVFLPDYIFFATRSTCR